MLNPLTNLPPESSLAGPLRNGVLIVEDETLIALQIEDILVAEGIEVEGIVADLASFHATQVSPRVALVDINLRDGPTGPEIARLLAQMCGTAIIYVTANPEQIGEPVPTAAGVLRKPFSPSAVMSAIAYATGDLADKSALPLEMIPFPRNPS